VGQVQVNPKIELTFASGLRSFLRQDPDVILVGEIRDLETAEIAIQASLTGHLVFSTLHTNDAAGATTRLADMGVQPFLVASSLVGVLAQRLIRVLCKECKKPYRPTAEELDAASITPAILAKAGNPEVLYRSAGCPACQNTGYQGRTGIYELMLVDDDIRQLILKNVDSNTIKKRAVQNGMLTLLEHGAFKIARGISTAAEVLSVTAEDL
jgi:general secretion pathway protein E